MVHVGSADHAERHLPVDPNLHVELDEFTGHHRPQLPPARAGLGFDNSPVAHMWRAISARRSTSKSGPELGRANARSSLRACGASSCRPERSEGPTNEQRFCCRRGASRPDRAESSEGRLSRKRSIAVQPINPFPLISARIGRARFDAGAPGRGEERDRSVQPNGFPSERLQDMGKR